MKIVRDCTKNKQDYKGHPCYAVDAMCPCRPCYNPHDCTPPNPCYSKKVYSDIFHCAVNWNNGCPQPLPEPNHTLNRQKRCIRCKEYIREQAGAESQHTDSEDNNEVRSGAKARHLSSKVYDISK